MLISSTFQMPNTEKISLYDFAKMVLGGREPTSVSILDANKNKEITKITYFGNGDKFESLRFSENDFFAVVTKSNESDRHLLSKKLEFPGVV